MSLRSDDNCEAGLDALARVRELRRDIGALSRRTDRLDETMSSVEQRLDAHESSNREAVEHLHQTLNDVRGTVDKFNQTVSAAISTPPVPVATTAIQNWRSTPIREKATLTGGAIALLMTPDIFKAVGRALWEVVKHWMHLP